MKGSKSKTREYFGRLRFQDTEELVKAYPLLWFKEDENGGWIRVKNILSINNLFMQEGAGVPSKPAAVKQAVGELVQSCIQEGADPGITELYQKPLLFSDLLVLLEEKGLAKPSPQIPPAQQVTKAVDKSLENEYRIEVKDYINREEKNDVYETGSRNVVTVSAPFDLNGGNIEYIIEGDNLSPPPNTQQSNTDGGQTLDDAFVALSAEHDAALAANKNLVAELNQARAKNLQLEDQISSDQGALLTGIEDMISTKLDEKFDAFEREFSSKIGMEIRSENARQTGFIMEELSAVRTIGVNVGSVNSFLSEHHEGTAMAIRNVSEGLKAVTSLCQENKDICTKVQSLVASDSSSKSYKQFGNSGNPGVLETPDRKASLLLTPHSASRTLRKCSECGSTSHLKQNCPKAPFCARCLSTTHKPWNCYSLNITCTLCQENGLKELSVGHHRKIHHETLSYRREHIMRTIHPTCFPDWTSAKRKASDS